MHALLIGLGAGLLCLGLWFAGGLDGFENATWSWRARLLARPSPFTSRIRIVAIDQTSLDWVRGRDPDLSWPWPRQVYAPILAFLARARARVVACDMIFEQPSTRGVEDDRRFAAAIAAGPPFVGVVSLTNGKGVGSWPAWARTIPLAGLRAWEKRHCPVALPRARFPVSELGKNMRLLGNVIEEPDPDGIVRRVHLFRAFAGRAVPSLALAAYLAVEPVGCRLRGNELLLGETRGVRLDRGGGALLRWRGPRGTHRKYSAAAVIQSEIRLRQGGKPVLDPGEFRDCYVLLIPTAAGTHDLKATPVGRRYPGGEIHATALDNLLAGDFMRPTPAWLTILSTLLVAVMAAGLTFRPARTWLTVAAFLALLLPVGMGMGAYAVGLWWPVVPQGLAVAMAVAGVVVLKYATEGRQRRFISQAFAHYLSPEVIKRIQDDPSHLRLGGERRELSIFFSDLQGFTSISEKLDPTALTTLLNDYLSDMTDIILDLGGTLDKYEGDAIIAFWNAPLDQPDHALRAVKAAVACQNRLAARRAEFQERTGQLLHMRIGINTGEVVVGNMGSRRRFDYTVLGDAANLASRLEGANKALGTYTMVAAATWEQAREACPELAGRELGDLRVVGRKEPVRVYEPRGLKEALAPAALGAFETFARGLAAVRVKDWPAAVDAFAALGDDPAASTYLRRCRRLVRDRDEDWDGVWNLASK